MCGAEALALIIVFAGLMGGLCNAWRARLIEENGFRRYVLLRIVEGMIAAATVPLFLSLIGTSDVETLLTKAQASNAALEQSAFKILGFCLIAALSAQRFLDTLTSKVFNLEQEVKAVARRANDATDKVELLTNLVVESDDPKLATKSNTAPLADGPRRGPEAEVLWAFGAANIPARSIKGLALSTGLAEPDLERHLGQLAALGLVSVVATPRGGRWALTPAGREVLDTRFKGKPGQST